MEETNKITTVVELNTQQAATAIVKLNATVSNSTKSLEERIAAKNKVIEIQNQISEKTIKALENERRTLEGRGATEKELQAIFVKLNKAKLDALKTSEQNAVSLDRLKSSQEKANKAIADGKDPLKNLDSATGGLIEKFKLFLANPIGITITLLVGLFKLFSEAISRNEKATESLNKIISKFTGFLNGALAVIGKVAEFLLNKLTKAIDNPKQALSDLGTAIQENLINRVKSFLVIGEAVVDFFKGNFKKSLKGVTDGIVQMGTGVANASSKLEKLGKSALTTYSKAAVATEKLANATKSLEKNQVLLEQSDLRSKKLAEDQRQIRDDTSKSFKVKIAANKQLGVILDSQLKKELSLAKQTLSIETSKQSAFGKTSETIAGVNAARTKILEIEERIGGQRSEQLVNQNSLLKEQSDVSKKAADDSKKAATDKKAAAEKESAALLEIKKRELKAFIELAEQDVTKKKTADPKSDTLQAEKDILQKKKELELLNTDLLESEKLVIKQSYAQQEVDLVRKTEFDKVQAILDAKNREIENSIVLDEIRLDAKKNSDSLTLEQSEANLAEELSIIERRKQYEISAKDLTEKEKSIITEKYSQEAIAIQKTSDEAIKKSKESLNAQILGGLAETFGIQKEVAVAQMIMAAPEAVGNSFKNAAKVYAPPVSLAMGALGAAATVVPIIKGLSDIKKTRFPGKGGKSSSGGGSISSTVGSSVTSAAIGDLTANNAAQLGVDPSIRSSATADASNNVLGSTTGRVVFSEGKYSDFKNQVEFKEKKTSI